MIELFNSWEGRVNSESRFLRRERRVRARSPQRRQEYGNASLCNLRRTSRIPRALRIPQPM